MADGVSPITTAILAGVVGLAGTMLGGMLNLHLEQKKQQGSLMLESIKTGNKTMAARNLLFFSDAGLLQLSQEQIKNLRKEAGDSTLPMLPLPERFTPMGSSSLTPELHKELQSTLESFEDYLIRSGFHIGKGEVHFTIIEGTIIKRDGREFASLYNPDTNTMQVASAYKDDTDLIMHEYMRHILDVYTHVPYSATESPLWVGYAIASALADYFPCSFNNKPVLASKSGLAINLINKHTFDRISLEEVFTSYEPELPWGGAFWELRQVLGQAKTDQLLSSIWASWYPSDPQRNIAGDFVQAIMKADESAGG